MALATEFPASVVGVGQAGPVHRRRTIRAEINPMDKSTVVSIYPRALDESNKWTLQPNEYRIHAGSYEKPAILIVGPASWWRDVDPDQPLLEIPVGSFLIADSIVKDFCNSIYACDMGDNVPGLFYVPGCKFDKEGRPSNELTAQWIKIEYKTLLDKAKARQDNWYRTLIKIADTSWARTNGSPLAISDDMRLAAKELGLDKEWSKDARAVDMVRCVACGNLRNPAYPVCLHCRTVIDKEAYDKLNLKPAV